MFEFVLLLVVGIVALILLAVFIVYYKYNKICTLNVFTFFFYIEGQNGDFGKFDKRLKKAGMGGKKDHTFQIKWLKRSCVFNKTSHTCYCSLYLVQVWKRAKHHTQKVFA